LFALEEGRGDKGEQVGKGEVGVGRDTHTHTHTLVSATAFAGIPSHLGLY